MSVVDKRMSMVKVKVSPTTDRRDGPRSIDKVMTGETRSNRRAF